MRICQECGNQSKRPLTRDRCPTCYSRLLRALKKAGTFESRYKRSRLPRSLRERMLQKTTPGWGGCVIWTGGTSDGYAVISVSSLDRVAHRALYEILLGPVPEGMELDHTCHTEALDCPGGQCIHRRCINPHHLEPVTSEENKRRGRSPMAANALKTHCPHGHEYSEDNTYQKPNGHRICRECRRIQYQAAYVKRPRVQVDRTQQTHCHKGHPQDETTTFADERGRQRCRECRRESSRQSKARKRQARKG